MTQALQDEAVTLLRKLVQLDTTNPPGKERPAYYCARCQP